MTRKQQAAPHSTVPEGGWGWMVTVGMAIMFISTTGHYTAFGLLFQDFLDKLDSRTTGATVIMNALTAAVNFTGLVTNYLLRTMSYRVVSVIGGLLFSVGIILTVVADSIIQVVITYSIIAGVGLGLLAPSSYLAFNSYFNEKRGIAMGICQAAIGLGFMVAPPVCQYLLEQYSFRGAILILGGIALNSIVGAMLFRPLKVPSSTSSEPEIETTEELEPAVVSPNAYDEMLCMAVIPEEDDELTNDTFTNTCTDKMNALPQIAAVDTECDEHIVISRRGSLVMSAMLDRRNVMLFDEESQNGGVYNSTTEMISGPDESRLNQRPMSASLTNFSSTLLMFDNSMTNSAPRNPLGYQRVPRRRPIIRHMSLEITTRSLLGFLEDDIDESNQEQSEPKRTGTFHYILQALSHFLDLSLFKDIIYMNIVLGLSLSFVSDSNFFTIFPLHLINEKLPRSDIALYISIAAGADVVSRLVLPWIANLCHITSRTTYLIACLASAIARSIVVMVPSEFMPLAVMSGVIGFFKGGMVVNLSLTIGQHCSNEKFAGAYSLFMVITGIMTLSIGSFVERAPKAKKYFVHKLTTRTMRRTYPDKILFLKKGIRIVYEIFCAKYQDYN
ncbi:Uncharacterized protein GBIM_07590 [Gryllus bimaculatus]|nr:Uncharacterized protein GBIM_07590 [Gryllus bimaculatus]